MPKYTSTKEVPRQGLEDAIRLFLLKLQNEDEDDEKDAEIRERLKKIETELANERVFTSPFYVRTMRQEVRGLMMLLRECIISHRWKPTLHLLTILVNYLPDTRSAVFKAGLEVFFQDTGDHENLLDQFLGQLKVAEGCWNRKEIVIEFALFLMSQGEYQKAKDQLKNVGALKGCSKVPTEYTTHWERLHKIYQGLSHYMDWWMCAREIKELQETLLGPADDEQEQELIDRIRVQEYAQQSNADRALDCLRELHKAPGVWDTFILKHVELLEFKGAKDSAHEVLKTYQRNNPSNPNAVRYLYEFYVRYNYDVDTIIEALKMFCDMVPSDRLCLELHSRLIVKGESPGDVLDILFDLLDHFQWQDDAQAWKLLSDQLQLSMTRKETTQIDDAWQNRKSWWPAYHFRKDQAIPLNQEQNECLPHRGCVAAALLGCDNQFTQCLVEQNILDIELVTILSTLPGNAN